MGAERDVSVKGGNDEHINKRRWENVRKVEGKKEQGGKWNVNALHHSYHGRAV